MFGQGPFGRALAFRGGPFLPRLPSRSRGKASSQEGAGSVQQPKSLLSNPLLKAAMTSATLSSVGDLVAQGLTRHYAEPTQRSPYDPARTARMFGFGFTWYGPYQFYWYRFLEGLFPRRAPAHFLAKVFLNQSVLAPLVLLCVFSWNLALQGQAREIPGKLKRDLVPTMINGWKFWVPAASINFWLVPLERQVLYMSTCGIVWTAYLSFSSYSGPQLRARGA